MNETLPIKKVTVIDKAKPENQQGFLGGFYVRKMNLGINEKHEGHAHWIDHVSNITKPPLRIHTRNTVNGEEGIIDVLVPCKINIPAMTWHQFEPLSDAGCEWECWFSQKEAEDKYDVPVPYHMERN